MKESQAEIKAIQAKLQSLQSGRKPTYQYSPLPQADTPQSRDSTTATLTNGRLPDMAAKAEALQQRSVPSFQLQQLTLKPRQATPEVQIAEEIKRLEAQAERVNQLSVAQEAALLELRAIAEKLERDRQSIEPEADGFAADRSPVCEYLMEGVPYVEREPDGAFIVTTRSIDLFRAEREATLMAQTLRRRSGRPSYEPPLQKRGGQRRAESGSPLEIAEAWSKLWQRGTQLAHQFVRRRRASPGKAASPAPAFTLPDAVIWVVGSMIARVGINLVLSSFPGLWLPIAALILTPAAIAIYQIAISPETGSIWGYRLFLVMAGLLIGGRLL
jgi:hypothetical protein